VPVCARDDGGALRCRIGDARRHAATVAAAAFAMCSARCARLASSTRASPCLLSLVMASLGFTEFTGGSRRMRWEPATKATLRA
jgi:hypothetical protein